MRVGECSRCGERRELLEGRCESCHAEATMAVIRYQAKVLEALLGR